ncbi:N-acetylmuramoyl-L-alanine amidase [Geodermatophilus sp. SYSU D00525]
MSTTSREAVPVRRFVACSLLTVAMTGTVLVLPVYAAPTPEPEPVTTSVDEVPMGSVEDPAPRTEVQEGTTEPVAGVAEDTPTLTVRRTGVDEFALVGVTWALDPAVTDTLVQVRVQDADGDWGAWTEVTAETADADAGARSGAGLRGGTSPLWTGPSTGVEVELVTRAGAAPTDVQLDLVDPGESEADTALTTPAIQDTAQAALAMPPVYSRAQWGADERIRTWAPRYAATVEAATLHHTADSNDYTADDVPAIMRSIYRYHTVSLGWGDIGYHVVVDKFGRLWEGRYGGLASAVVAAHAGGFNTGTFGVSMLGNHDTVPVPQATVDAVAAVVAWKFSLYGIDPRGRTTLTSEGGGTSRYARGTSVTLPTLFGHRDVGSTACPGRYGYARLPEIRDAVAARMNGAPTIEGRYASDPSVAWLGARVGAQQTSGDVTWQVFQNGRMYSSPSTGVHAVRNAILDRYLAAGGPAALGAPTTDEMHTADGRGAYTHFARGSVFWSPSTGAQDVRNAIRDRWAALGWERGALGYPTSTELPTADGSGRYQLFQGGRVYWSAATGVHEVVNAVLGVHQRLGGISGLGYPTSDELPTAGGVGRVQHFQTGSVLWSPATGAFEVRNGIRTRWAALGAETGVLGYPVSGELPTADGAGRYQLFQRGRVYWSAATGVHEVVNAVLGVHQRLGALTGLGYPTSDEVPTADGVGRVQHFQTGSVVWSPPTGAFEVRNGIRARWTALGAEAGVLGYPTSGELPTADGAGRYQVFQGGRVYWSAATGVHEVVNAVLGVHQGLGALAGLGYPTSDEVPTADGVGRVQHFQTGSVLWSPATGAFEVRNGIRARWAALGAEAGVLGYPVTGELPTADGAGRYQLFQRGAVFWSRATGTHEVLGGIWATYRQMGAQTSPLGLPTSGETAVTAGWRSTFERGSITWEAATGRVTVTRR